MNKQIFDFSIPETFKRREIKIDEKLTLKIPQSAHYLNINPLEDESEFLGNQGDSNRQELIFYDLGENPIDVYNLDKQITTEELMNKLERILVKQY
ncbi:hypothetical protein J4229_02290 [Candidatus Pacearchaeota archaeon]|nr:hypothetical protein [Candidatus Pacearchaeota archaeon]